MITGNQKVIVCILSTAAARGVGVGRQCSKPRFLLTGNSIPTASWWLLGYWDSPYSFFIYDATKIIIYFELCKLNNSNRINVIHIGNDLFFLHFLHPILITSGLQKYSCT